MKKYFLLVLLVFFLVTVSIISAKSKPEPSVVMLWPSAEKLTLKLTFGKFQQVGAYAGQISFFSEVIVENMSGKTIPRASFTVYLVDKGKVRIGDGVLNVSDLGIGQQVKIPFQFRSVGIPASLNLTARNDAAGVPTSLRTISLKVISVPPGANLKVDGHDEGVTPRMVDLPVGTHSLEFSKQGYATGSTPVEITQDELPGGSISFELGGLSRDTVELQDGTVLLGDVVSLSLTTVVVRVDGSDRTYDRNQIKKIMLVERVVTQEPPVTRPVPMQPKQ